MSTENILNEEVKAYPTPADANGYRFDNEEDEAMGVETRYDAETDCTFKRVQLTQGRTAVIRELGAKEMKLALKMIGNVPGNRAAMDKLPDAYVALSTTITDAKGEKYSFVMEDLEDVKKFKGKDYNKLVAACTAINF